eukprot:scaffold11520_cov150-Skeletonema_dohrnii-CCMP3373.AAC.2
MKERKGGSPSSLRRNRPSLRVLFRRTKIFLARSSTMSTPTTGGKGDERERESRMLAPAEQTTKKSVPPIIPRTAI